MLLRRLGECSAHATRRAASASASARRARVALPPVDASSPAIAPRFASSAATSAAQSKTPSGMDDMRGLSSRDVFDSAPSSTFLKARLKQALTEINRGQSSSGDKINAESAKALLYATDALRPYPDVLQPHLSTASAALSSFYTAHAAADEDVEALQGVLAHACLAPRNVASQRARQQNSVYTIANRYAEWLVAEARRGRADSARLGDILTRFEGQVRDLGTAGSDRLMVPFVAAWAVLNARTGRTRPGDVVITLPHDSTITGWVSTNAWTDAAGGADVNAAAKALCDAADDAAVPTSLDGLAARLFSLRNRGKVSTLVELWDAYAAELDNASKHPLVAKDVRMEALAKFLSVVRSRSSQSASRTVHEREVLTHIEAEVRKRVPKPTPLPVLHTLLSTAGPEDLEDGAGLPRDKTAVLGAAKEIWEAAQAEGVVRDERAYGIYLGLLGRYHEGAEMFKVWDELVADTSCRELEAKRAEEERKAAKNKGKAKEKETKGAGPWPSTLILNQVLSSAFIIGSRPADMALALYRIAVQPKSPLEADLFTLNIALRFASYCSDLKLMNEIISAAGPLGLVPDIVTYTTLVQGLLRAGRPELARQTLDSMKSRGMEPNERMAAMLVADLAANGRADGLTRAEDVIRDMRTRGIRTTVPMWTSLIAGYFRGGWQVDAWAALDRMRASGLRLNDIGYNVVLRHVLTADAGPAPTTTSTRARRALGHQMSADKSTASLAMKVFHHMKDNSVPPTADTYTILLGGLLRSDSVGDIRDVLNDIDVRGFKTHNRSLSEMIRTARKSLTRSARMRGDRL